MAEDVESFPRVSQLERRIDEEEKSKDTDKFENLKTSFDSLNEEHRVKNPFTDKFMVNKGLHISNKSNSFRKNSFESGKDDPKTPTLRIPYNFQTT